MTAGQVQKFITLGLFQNIKHLCIHPPVPRQTGRESCPGNLMRIKNSSNLCKSSITDLEFSYEGRHRANHSPRLDIAQIMPKSPDSQIHVRIYVGYRMPDRMPDARICQIQCQDMPDKMPRSANSNAKICQIKCPQVMPDEVPRA